MIALVANEFKKASRDRRLARRLFDAIDKTHDKDFCIRTSDMGVVTSSDGDVVREDYDVRSSVGSELVDGKTVRIGMGDDDEAFDALVGFVGENHGLMRGDEHGEHVVHVQRATNAILVGISRLTGAPQREVSRSGGLSDVDRLFSGELSAKDVPDDVSKIVGDGAANVARGGFAATRRRFDEESGQTDAGPSVGRGRPKGDGHGLGD